jgi:tricorn protease
MAEEARLLRFPDIHRDKVAFVYAGDIWVASSGGGRAERLTSDEGLELFPKFSPDGRRIAFSAEYSGSRQVYVMSVDGGLPRQLTFYNDVGPMPPRGGFDYRVLDWTPDGKHILIRANRLPWGVRMGRLYLVPAEGGMERPLPIPESGPGMFSPDGTRVVYTPLSREFRTWKRYRGGRAQDVWIFDLESGAAEQITEFEGTDNQPTWVGDMIYFTSDRDRRLNLYAYDTASRETRQVTHHEDFDVLWPSAGPEQVVYECGGFLYRFDPEEGTSVQIPIQISGDFLNTMPRFRDVRENISSASLSPSGKRALLGARGEVFTAPAEKGEVRNLTRTASVREMDPTWSPDGRWIAYLSDRSGEYEIYTRAQDGSGEERQVTHDGDTWRFPPRWSPDGTRLAFGDKKQRLRYVDVESGSVVDVDTSEGNDIQDYRWSPDSRWLVYTKVDEAFLSSIYVYSLEQERVHRLTDDLTNDYQPVFDPEGRYLYFLSDRDYDLTFSGYEFNYLYADTTRVYVATLQADGPPLLAPTSDEEEPEEADGEKKETPSGDDEEAPKPLSIDVAGFGGRVVALPDPAGNYRSLEATADSVLYLVGDGEDAELRRFKLEEEEVEVILKGIELYDVSDDGKKVLYRADDTYGIVELGPDKKVGDGALNLDGLQMKVDPRAEWKQIFLDGWRITRDWFYDPNLHGVDWEAVRELYAPLVEHVAHRADLDYIFGELGGELSAGHYYVGWGDFPRPKRIDGGLLGAEIEPDTSGYFRVTKIYAGENWHPGYRSPLTEPGVDVREGDLILSVDGESTRGVPNFYRLLENTADRTVVLRVNDEPTTEGSREARVRPVPRETNLRYLDWVRSRRERVDELSGGRIGYIHLPNTAEEGNRELQKHFFPQSQKDALIFDARYNGGGFIPDRMIELATRTQLSYWARRGIQPMRTPAYAHTGPKACLINGLSSSGGDAFPYYFRKLGLGKLIGTRTWGGLIGLQGNPGLMDGGTIAVPRFRFFDTEGEWDVENIGVAPDIEVVDRPDLVARGHDPTLEKAVEVLLDELERQPPDEVDVPVPPRVPR